MLLVARISPAVVDAAVPTPTELNCEFCEVLVKVAAEPDALPVKEAVIVPALKFPDASRATIADAVFAFVAVVAELLTFKAVEIVASFVSTIAADALMSALTITPAAIEVALPTEVTSPVRLAFVVTLLAVNAVAVPVMFVPTKADGVPNAGVTSVGLSDSTLDPVPVEDVTPVPPLATGRVPLT